jgi:hypothetical protein
MDKNKLKKMADALLDNPIFSMFCPNPNNHAPILYKYRNWNDEYHKNLLIKNELFLSPPSLLNDPFDTRIYDNYIKKLKTKEQKENYINESIQKNLKYFLENNISIDEGRKILEKRVEDSLYYQVRSEVIYNEIFDKGTGIACLSENWNSILMWSHYADNHKGYCIGFDEKWIRFCQKFGKVMRVEYTDKYPEPIKTSKENELTFEQKYFYKSSDWKYEEEIRLVNIYNNENPNRIEILENKYIKEVILGLNTPEEHKEEIISYAKNKNIDVWQTMKGDFEFKIERYKI